MDLEQMFCTGTTNLVDGSILVNGGSEQHAVARYDWKLNKFFKQGPMNKQHGYNANAITTLGTVFTVGGSWSSILGGRDGEVFTYDETIGNGNWTLKKKILGNAIGGMIVNGTKKYSPDPEGIYRSDNHAWLASFEDPNGKPWVAHFGPVTMMHVMGLEGDGVMIEKGYRSNDSYAINAATAHFTPGKLFKAGGAKAYQVSIPASSRAFIMDFTKLPADPVKNPIGVTNLPNMHYARTFASAVVLPGGRVLVVGGQYSVHSFTDHDAVYQPEIFDPSTNTFTLVSANLTHARTYHSVAVLMPNAKVFVGGGGLCPGIVCTVANPDIHYDGEIFTPYYLLTGQPRPTIETADSTLSVKSNNVIKISTTQCHFECKFELIRFSSATHTVNQDQMRVPLDVKYEGPEKAKLSVPHESLPFVLPGYYMLFAISEHGVPSNATSVRVDRN
ncbi:hypothetical protein HDU76_009530 [Blyttiomyces sp. JEL0837]|nr:hypothetical protein HDU76_009530 [Blyttiomyces sp. JEL0837]